MRQVITEVIRKYVEELVEEGYTSGALDLTTAVREKLDEMNVGGMIEDAFKDMVDTYVKDNVEDVVMEVLNDGEVW